jgi:uncharacterized membrane protein YkoI
MKLYKKIITLLFIGQLFIGQAYSCETAHIVLAEAKTISLDEAVANVKKNKIGKVLSAETVQVDGNAVHVIKVLKDDGHVKKLNVSSSPKK